MRTVRFALAARHLARFGVFEPTCQLLADAIGELDGAGVVAMRHAFQINREPHRKLDGNNLFAHALNDRRSLLRGISPIDIHYEVETLIVQPLAKREFVIASHMRNNLHDQLREIAGRRIDWKVGVQCHIVSGLRPQKD